MLYCGSSVLIENIVYMIILQFRNNTVPSLKQAIRPSVTLCCHNEESPTPPVWNVLTATVKTVTDLSLLELQRESV